MAGKRSASGFWTTPSTYLLGGIGVTCITISIMGLIWISGPGRGLHSSSRLAAATGVRVVDTASARTSSQRPRAGAVKPSAAADYYPLQVGRYWVYVRERPGTGSGVEVERRIVRRESGPDQDLYYFADGSMAFRQDGRVFEVGAQGGVNVVPVGAEVAGVPYVYRSQGLRIEKTVGVQDTVLVLNGREYHGCRQVITRFSRDDGQDVRMYASYYAPGVGLISREIQADPGGASTAEILRDYGPRQL